MKKRIGFVSNSSSSSFFIFIESEKGLPANEAIAELLRDDDMDEDDCIRYGKELSESIRNRREGKFIVQEIGVEYDAEKTAVQICELLNAPYSIGE